MEKRKKQKQRKLKGFPRAVCWLGAFCLWTVAVYVLDVQPIGPMHSEVGFATLNGGFHHLTGVHWWLYHITDWLSLIPLGIVFGFAALGLIQWISRKKLCLVDTDLLILGAFYLVVILLYLLFEGLEINYRPVLINGVLEPSYPSSTTILVICVMTTAAMQMKRRVKNKLVRRCILWMISAFTAFMVIGRVLSGVHWLTDIIGGGMLSIGLVELYAAASLFNKSANCD